MRLMWVEWLTIDEGALLGERVNIMQDEVETHTGQKPTVVLEGGIVSANRRMVTSVFGGNLLERDGTVYMTKTCQVQEEK